MGSLSACPGLWLWRCQSGGRVAACEAGCLLADTQAARSWTFRGRLERSRSHPAFCGVRAGLETDSKLWRLGLVADIAWASIRLLADTDISPQTAASTCSW